MAKRFKIRFPSQDALIASQAIETPGADAVLTNEKRRYISMEVADISSSIELNEAVALSIERTPTLAEIVERFGAEIVEDYQYELDDAEDDFSFEGVEDVAEGSLSDVTDMIKAPAAWDSTTGKEATIAIVDTGIDGSHPEFPDWKKAGNWEPLGDTPWTDWQGHGTMCAAISAASNDDHESRYRGVAPDAKLIACKTQFYDSELAAIYDFLTEQVEGVSGPLIASNSFGRKTGAPPPVPSDSDFIPALDDAIAAGVTVFFSAGNNHQRAGGSPSECTPNSIWLHKSRADVFAVATCELNKKMWYYSSRGPGQHYGDSGMSRKPDVTAPTPRNGEILYGGGERILPNGWGTSGACPQAAGLAALMVSLNASLSRDAIFDAIRANARSISHEYECQGNGLIDCGATISQLLSA